MNHATYEVNGRTYHYLTCKRCKMDSVFERVKMDLDERNKLGWRQHGKPLRAGEPGNWLQEAYEEALDLCVYLKQELEQRCSTTGAGSLRPSVDAVEATQLPLPWPVNQPFAPGVNGRCVK